MRVLDTHLHLWDPQLLRYPWLDDIPALNRTFAVEELRAVEAELGEGSDVSYLFMQAECLPEQAHAEVEWVRELATVLPIRGIIARLAMEEDVRETADVFAADPLVVGVRRLIQGEPEGLTRRPAFLESARAVADAGLVFDACVSASQIAELCDLADAVPDLLIVLDHLGKPEVGSAEAPRRPGDTGWGRDIQDLAARPNVVCKLSGLPGESRGDWNEAQMRPFLDHAAEVFGGERLIFASDWPASFGADPVEGYGRWLTFVTGWAGNDASAVLFSNGARVYGV